jgi:hypothetical protein
MVIISDAEGFSRTRRKGEKRLREVDCMRAGMVHGMALFCPLQTLITTSKYWL